MGTRPEAVKMAPVVSEFRKFEDQAETLLFSTGQHRDILLHALKTFGLTPDEDLDIMTHGQTLAQVTSRALEGVDGWIERYKPAVILGQGDTTTVFVAALAAFYRQVPFAHVEAGLRTKTIANPFPEEFNRRAAGLVAALHFPPTSGAKANLLREGKDPASIFVTGNTGTDAVLFAAAQGEQTWYPEHKGKVVLLTTHRRENWGAPQEAIAKAARQVIDRHPDALLVVPMHPNPTVREVLTKHLSGHPRIALIEPPDYAEFVKLTQRSDLILTDSGGVQEEAPAFGIPVLVLRETTERPEGVSAGTAKLVGTDAETIFKEANSLLSDQDAYRRMAQAVSPYGDGQAAARIRYFVLRHLGLETEEVQEWLPHT